LQTFGGNRTAGPFTPKKAEKIEFGRMSIAKDINGSNVRPSVAMNETNDLINDDDSFSIAESPEKRNIM
jgi:hypothetical protein